MNPFESFEKFSAIATLALGYLFGVKSSAKK